ncbi:MAG: helix-turn-helix transcriptional regulator [Eubacteriales bacterium]|nr:helix-turn-helix transcriptional regulator [Eubacteriales bacterium]
MKLNKAFSLRVRELLKEKKMTQYKLAQETGLYHSTMTDILNCKYQTPNFKNMALIIRALGMTMAEFFDSKYFDFNDLDIDD